MATKDHNEAEVTPASAPKGVSPTKGAPTPKRRDAQARNYRPIVADHKKMTREEKKAARAAARATQDEEWKRAQQAMKTGDERNMPAQHRGPVRRFARDYLDARLNLGTGFMPLAVILVLSLFVQSQQRIFVTVVLTIYALFFLMLADSWWAVRNARILIEHKFGPDKVPYRFTWQMMTRTFYFRRWRLPAPQVKLGEFPQGGSPLDLRQAKKARRKAKKR